MWTAYLLLWTWWWTCVFHKTGGMSRQFVMSHVLLGGSCVCNSCHTARSLYCGSLTVLSLLTFVTWPGSSSVAGPLRPTLKCLLMLLFQQSAVCYPGPARSDVDFAYCVSYYCFVCRGSWVRMWKQLSDILMCLLLFVRPTIAALARPERRLCNHNAATFLCYTISWASWIHSMSARTPCMTSPFHCSFLYAYSSNVAPSFWFLQRNLYFSSCLCVLHAQPIALLSASFQSRVCITVSTEAHLRNI